MRTALWLVAAVAITACQSSAPTSEPKISTEPIEILSASSIETGLRLEIRSCTDEVLASTSESTIEVTVKIARAATVPKPASTCSADIDIALQRPLDGRSVVDGWTGNQVAVNR